tara:strand:- start:269 stop:625 length:357 start_codon:yes stop_codon:yes gene_type:complete
MNGIRILNTEETTAEDSYTVDCITCNTQHSPAMAPVAVDIWWLDGSNMEGEGLWVSTVVAADGGEAHTTESYYDAYQSRIIEITKEEMNENYNNYFGDATEIRVFTKAAILKKTISIR